MTVRGWIFLALLWLVSSVPLGAYLFFNSSASEIDPSKIWMGVYIHGHKIGYATSQVSRKSDGFLIEERATLQLVLQGTTRKVKTHMDLKTDFSFQMRSFEMGMVSDPFVLEMKGTLKGHSLVLQVRSGDTTRNHEIHVDEVPWLAQNLRYHFLQKPLQLGDSATVTLLDPLTLTYKPMEFVVEGTDPYAFGDTTLSAFRLLFTWNGLESRAWVSERGEMLREEGFGGMTLIRETPAEALDVEAGIGSSVDLITEISIHVSTALPSPRELSYMKIRFSGAELTNYSLSDHRQKTQGQYVEVFREDLCRIREKAILDQKTPEEGALAPTPFVQSDDPQIQELANSLTTGARDELESVRRIMEWVYGNLRKVPTVSVPSAVEVLRRKEGDCNEHAVLFAALTRALGIPTRICAGIVYMNGRFSYHAWNMVYVGNWVSVDPTLGQVAVDATHVKFVEGGLDTQVKLAPLIGTLQAEILDYR